MPTVARDSSGARRKNADDDGATREWDEHLFASLRKDLHELLVTIRDLRSIW